MILKTEQYHFLEQENMSDLQFISERCELEGCAFVIYDGKIILYSGSN